MKKFTIILAFFLLANTAIANAVDSIQNDDDVVVFLKRIDQRFNSDKTKQLQVLTAETIRQRIPCDGIAESWRIKNWEKVDFNGDNKTDLIVTALWYDFEVFVALDKGDNTYQLIKLSRDFFQNCELGKPVKINSEQLLLFYRVRNEYNEPKKDLFDFKTRSRIDTLIYKYGGFIEWQKQSASYDISEIEYHSESGWKGVSPVFKLKIATSHEGIVESTLKNGHKGIQPTAANKEIVRAIVDLIQYIHIKDAKNKYSVTWTDDTTIFLKVHFTDGTVKEIEDYGLAGSFGLAHLYELLFTLGSPQR